MYFYFLYYDQNMGEKSIYCKKNMISPVSNGGFVEKDRALLYIYAPYLEKVKG